MVSTQLSLGFSNALCFGDNLEILRRHVKSDSIDLVYLDPPFKSNRSFNLLFERKDGTKAAGQIKAFDDTWSWSIESARTYEEVVERGGDVSQTLRSFRALLGPTDMLAYLTMMAPRLVELRRVLKSTGSLYLHCDSTASHYLKILLDAVFGPENFRNEIVWKRTSAHSDYKQGRKGYGSVHDTLLFYSSSGDFYWQPYFTPYDESYLETEYRHESDDGARYKEADVTAAKPGGDTSYEWRVKRSGSDRWQADLENEYLDPRPGVDYRGVHPYRNRYWAYSKENMAAFAREGRLIHRSTGMPRLILRADDMPGLGPQDVWTDISPVAARANERIGWPTQKPRALLERIIASSCPREGIVLDPFCGCGTAVDAAQELGRQWIGIDITKMAVDVMIDRLEKVHGTVDYILVGEPSTMDEAEALAQIDKHEFQAWACRRIGASGVHAKGADRGIDGEFVGVYEDGSSWRGLVSVKGGSITVAHLRDLRGTVERENAEFGVFVSLRNPTPAMKREAADAGFTAEGIPRLQLVTAGQIVIDDDRAVSVPAGRRSETKRRKLRAV